jgi:hypothetical protein
VGVTVAGEVKRVGNRAWREMIARVPPVGWAVNRRYEGRLREYADQLAPLSPLQQQLLNDVAVSGASITSLDALGLSGIDSMKESAARLGASLEADSSTGSPLRSDWSELLDEIEMWQWGLREDVLDLAEAYLGLPAWYFGAEVRRERVDGRQDDVRQWHRDTEDQRMFKVLVWLDDVGPMDGAFEWIPRDLTDSTTRALGYVAGFRGEREMAEVVAPSRWQKAAGPRWTAVLADTCNVFHRAGTPRDNDRYSVTFSWSSRWPFKTYPVEPFTTEQAAKMRSGLNARQLASLPPALVGRHRRS